MNDGSLQEAGPVEQELLYFWAFGDLHYRACDRWHAIHSRRLEPMFRDVRSLWLDEGSPAFCVSPGDIVDTGAPENYRLAKKDLAAQLGSVPFYPGIGNHEFHPESRDDQLHTAGEYSTAWDRPVRYYWTVDNILCIMLDQPNPYAPDERRENPHVVFAPETLDFLDTTLARFPERIAVVFAHCPLQNTVLDRDQERNLDEDSTDPFFYVENSDEVRAILARHANAALYISGHTHSGWGSPNLVFTETLGSHPVTHLNLMSPWYTGKHHGPRWSADRLKLEYRPDDPDVLASFAVRIYPHSALIHMRDHRARQWLTRWTVPIL
ncbi:MAG TPA: metallophosphoesterase [Ktedonobacteraceae bacterium]|nr:metallophosphoesterase [Ktedonobacteraceae bacterium]